MLNDDNCSKHTLKMTQISPPTTLTPPTLTPMSSKLKEIAYKAYNLKKRRRKLLEKNKYAEEGIEAAAAAVAAQQKEKQQVKPKTSQQLERGAMAMITGRRREQTIDGHERTINDNDDDYDYDYYENGNDYDDVHDDDGKSNNNNKHIYKSICLICRKELELDDCCWHCHRQEQEQQQITRTTRLILKQSECRLMTLRLAKTQRTDYFSIKQYQQQQKSRKLCRNCDNLDDDWGAPEQQPKRRLSQRRNSNNQAGSLILHCNETSNENHHNNNEIKSVAATSSQLHSSSSSTATLSSVVVEEDDASFRAAFKRNHHQIAGMLSHQEFYNLSNSLQQQQQQQKQNSKNHNQIIKSNFNINPTTTNITIATTTTKTKTTKSANNKLANNLNNSSNNNKNNSKNLIEINNNNNNNNNKNHNTNNKNAFSILMQKALRTFYFLTLFIHLQFLQNSSNSNNNNNKRQQQKLQLQQQHPQRLNKRLIAHQRTSYSASATSSNNNNSNHFFLNFYNSIIINSNSNSNKQRPSTCSSSTSPFYNCKHHSNNVQNQQQIQQQQEQPQWKHHCQLQLQLHRRLLQFINKFKMPNLSLLYKILIVLSFLSIFLPSSTHAHQPQQLSLPPLSSSSSSISAASSASLSSSPLTTSLKTTSVATSQDKVILSRNETVCKSLDLRNNPSEFSALRNCTVIEGFLVMTLVNTHMSNDFNETYPLLTEVTEFIIVYRVYNLFSLSQIFPNLSIIRGTILHEGYALVVYSNPHLEDLGLSKLTTILRGGVRIENNPSLCYVETIDWRLILRQNSTDVFIQNNRNVIECPLCPDDPKAIRHDADGSVESDAICKEYKGKRHCWNSKMCQKICPESCPNNCIDETRCCAPSCLGGCLETNTHKCIGCLHYSIFNSTCIDQCPRNYYSFAERRCITADACLHIGTKFENNQQETLVPFNNSCSTRCPPGFIKEGHRCVECGNSCTKKCEGGLIDSVSAARVFHGCTHIIKEGLTISIKRGGRHLMEDLEYGLSAIQVIDAFLKVHLTFGLFSLEFFKNLREIRGEILCEEKFALYALENTDLETLWGANQSVRIRNGRVFFHFNPKLCYNTIKALLRSITSMDKEDDFDKNEVAKDSNGSKGSCNPEFLNTTVILTTATNARIKIVNPLKFDDERTFIGYQYFYMIDPYKNATKHHHRPCDDSWFVSEPTKETDFIIPSLKPYTQYAYYMKTMTISSESRNAQSQIQYFKTKSSQPNSVRKLEAYSNSSSTIILQWLPPAHVYGKLAMYKVRAKLDMRSQKSSSRNYCIGPLAQKGASVPSVPTPAPTPTEKPFDPDCKCYAGKDRSEVYDDEAAEANRHDVIDFENALQNFIYVKHTNTSSAKKENSDDMKRRKRHIDDDFESSFLVRHIRALPTKATISGGTGSLSTTTTTTTTKSTLSTITTVKPHLNSTTTTNEISSNTTKMDPDGIYYISFNDSVNASTTEFVFKQLKHFSIYLLEVEACREPEEGAKDKSCSEVLSTYVRTLQMENVDKVRNLKVSLEHSNTTRTNVRIQWNPPERPNGAIVSYTILYTVMAKDSVEEKKCITEQDYQNLTSGYILTGLQGGANYSIKVRANSLAGEGVESEAIFIQTPKPGTLPLWATIVLIIIGVLCIPAGAWGLYWWKQKKNVPPTDLRFYPSVNPYYHSLQYVPDNWEVARERVIQLSPLGQGSFGMVYEGILKGYDNSNEDTACAIKTVNENATDRERLNFLTEAGVMKQFDTFHVVKLLGVCSRGQPALVVMELMKFGDLKSYLRKHRPEERDDGIVAGTAGFLDGVVGSGAVRGGTGDIGQPPPLSRIYQMAIEIADGMAYLAAKKFVHRDLAARNCMVAADLTVKIGDFGMTRDIYETDYYRKGTKGLLPVRWMPPEALRDGVYSSASDVFSYGVVLWEMATLAAQPYQGLSNDQVLRYVIDGGVMERPENCPDRLYDLMQKCWQHRPSARPSFMDIIGYLLDQANDSFKDVSFYHSEEGQKILSNERNELQHSGDVFHDPDHDMDDATTPLRMNEYNEFQLNLDTNSSVENHGDSPMVIDDHPHSPYSLGSANIVSSTPDDQLKHSFSGSGQQNPMLSSAPSTSAGIIGGTGDAQQTARSYSRPVFKDRLLGGGGLAPSTTTVEDTAAYVQPDEGFIEEARIRPWRTASINRGSGGGGGNGVGNTNTVIPTTVGGGGGGRTNSETDERGYEVYDPSPKFHEQSNYDPADDEEDYDGIGFSRGGRMSGGQNLLPRQKSKQRLATIKPMSSSVPDEAAISAPMSSSAASSNASSSNATGGNVVGSAKYPTSLKRAVAETVQNVGNTLMPKGLRGIKPRFFSHKRTGSNASHKSTSSNPASSNSHTNLANAAGGTAAAGAIASGAQNLGTIESGGSASSYTAMPRFFTPATISSSTPPTTTTTTMSDNPNYKLLDETANISGISTASAEITTTPAKSGGGGSSKSASSRPATGFITGNKDPQYQLLKESLNTTTSPIRTGCLGTLSENPNYQPMQAPTPMATSTNTSSNPNYVMMNDPPPPPPASTSTASTSLQPKYSVNPNYQMMRAQQQQQPAVTATEQTSALQQQSTAATPAKFFPAYGQRISSSDEEDPDDDDADDDAHTEHIKMERMPLSRRTPQKQQSEAKQKKRANSRSRSRSKSRNKSVERTPATTASTPTATTPKTATTTQSGKPTTFSLKEKWLRQPQPPQPPPNGFIGREG